MATSNGGATWVRVDGNEHPHGQMQIYQPDATGVVYMPGSYSKLGAGVLRSTDYGETWTHVGIAMNEAVVFGTPKRVYAMYAWATWPCGGCLIDPALQSAPQPGISGWARMSTPPEMTIGPAQAATVFDGTNYIVLTANWRGGLWRFIERTRLQSASSLITLSPQQPPAKNAPDDTVLPSSVTETCFFCTPLNQLIGGTFG